MAERRDVAIVGGGLVGLATAHRLLARFPALRLLVIEKEAAVAAHQSGHNSGVIHSGVYYRPGSAKARLAVAGGPMLRAFCDERGVRCRTVGKLIVATEKRERPALDELLRRGRASGVDGVALVGPERLREIEPHAAGVAALHLPRVAVVDYREVARALADAIAAAGGEVRTNTLLHKVRTLPDGLALETSGGPIEARLLVACAGLQADRVAALDGEPPRVRIVPFRGDYLRLVDERAHLVRGLIYPVPDPRFPFLGVHLTRRIDDTVEAGPSAVVALARERYAKLALDGRDAWETLAFAGFWRLAARHLATGLGETYRTFVKRIFARNVQRLLPEVGPSDLIPAGCGIRAQALAPDGTLIDDFLFVERARSLHVLNAPSPAATACLAIGDAIADRLAPRLAGSR